MFVISSNILSGCYFKLRMNKTHYRVHIKINELNLPPGANTHRVKGSKHITWQTGEGTLCGLPQCLSRLPRQLRHKPNLLRANILLHQQHHAVSRAALSRAHICGVRSYKMFGDHWLSMTHLAQVVLANIYPLNGCSEEKRTNPSVARDITVVVQILSESKQLQHRHLIKTHSAYGFGMPPMNKVKYSSKYAKWFYHFYIILYSYNITQIVLYFLTSQPLHFLHKGTAI